MANNILEKKTRDGASAAESIHGGTYYTPRVDICETEKELMIYVDLPGCKPEDVDIRFEKGQLEIFGKCQARQENTGYLLNEFGVGDFYRAFTVNEAIDVDQMSATLKQGVLTVHLPKTAAAQPKKIAVKAE